MNTLTPREKLLAKRIYWERVADHMLDSAGMDINNNIHFDVAQRQLAGIDRSLKRINAGLYGQCERCRSQIDPERLETLIESDCHLCVQCAKTVGMQTAKPTRQQRLHPTYGRTALVGPFA